MKQRIFALLLLTIAFLASCQKDSVAPVTPTSKVSQKTTTTTTVLNQDTANTAIKGYLRLQLAEDAVNTDAVLIDFNPAAKTTYVKNEDALTFQGFGAVSLSSLSSDNVALAINAVPLTKTGLTIGLEVNAKASGVYKLNLTAISSVPASFNIWLKDKYKKDSLDFRHNPSYAFNISTTDAATYGSQRFSLVIR